MNVLEKILEEIEEKNKIGDDCNENLAFIDGVRYGLIEAKKIIRFHMEDGKDTNVGNNWIPIKWRDTTDEDGIDKEKYPIFMDCPMPNDGDEILITLKNGEVLEDTCFDDDGYYLDSGFDWVDDVKAWMPKPEGYKGE